MDMILTVAVAVVFGGFLVVVLWVEVVVDFMGFVPGGRGGFFHSGGGGFLVAEVVVMGFFFWWWWWWVSCFRGGGVGWLKER